MGRSDIHVEVVVGLEIHVQLFTSTKLFCGCAVEFGQQPNSRVCPVCLGLPGSLPVMNKKAVEYAMLAGLALNCKIASLHQVGPQELLLSRSAEELSDQPV